MGAANLSGTQAWGKGVVHSLFPFVVKKKKKKDSLFPFLFNLHGRTRLGRISDTTAVIGGLELHLEFPIQMLIPAVSKQPAVQDFFSYSRSIRDVSGITVNSFYKL